MSLATFDNEEVAPKKLFLIFRKALQIQEICCKALNHAQVSSGKLPTKHKY